MKTKLNQELKIAMKNPARYKTRISVIRMLKSKLEEESKRKGTKKKADIDVLVVYRNSLKKAQSIQNVPQDYITSLDVEIAIINEFLPQELSLEEAIEIAKQFELTQRNQGYMSPTNKVEIIAEIKKKAKDLKKICPGRVAFMAAKEILDKKLD